MSVTGSGSVAGASPEPAIDDYYSIGWSRLRDEDFAGAAASFRAAIAAGESFEDARYFLAVALGRDDRPDEAISALREFLAHHPASARSGDAAAMLGWLHAERGEIEAARVAFERAIAVGSRRARQSAQDGLDRLER